jgi:ATP-dependent helicase/nuclease subunit A
LKTPELVDAAARERIASDLDSTVFVEAGAGSGKTRSLVRRIVALVAGDKASITEIAAITFTELAAAELRLKVREGLAERAGDSEKPAAERRLCEEALGRIDEAPISTIHGFCRRILSSHPIEAGLPPRFEVLDEVAQTIEWRQRWGRELDLLAEVTGAPELVSLCFEAGVHDRRIEALARAIDFDWPSWDPTEPDLRAALARIEEMASAGLKRLADALCLAIRALSEGPGDNDTLCRRLEDLEALFEAVSASDWHAGLQAAFLAPRFSSFATVGNRANWGSALSEVRQLCEAVRQLHDELRQDVLDEVLAALSCYLQWRSHRAADERRARGVLSFDDLVVLCHDLLAGNPAVCQAVRRRYRYVLVDEFQDTDRLQLGIARSIGQSGEGWEPGRFFFVGDPKQSIYRFRGADVAAYESARGEIAVDGATLLSSNFRSLPGILGFVNGCFATLLGERFSALDAVRTEPGHLEPPVAVVGGALEAGKRRSELRQVESEDVCRVIERAVYSEGWLVMDEAGPRPARLGDVTILVPRRTGLAELEAALDAHQISYRVESASLILRSQEVRDVLHLARAIAEPGNERALVATLRSPCYSIGDDELLAFRAAGGHWTTEQPVPAAASRAAPAVAEALEDLASLQGLLCVLGPAATLSLAVRRRRLLQLAAARPHAREAWRRIRYVLERARLFTAAGGGGLSELADWIEEQLQGGARAAESVVPEADEDVVRIMTVHGAKGLEFPVTILCGFGTSDENSSPPDLVLRHQDGRPEVHFNKDLETSGYGELVSNERLLAREEALRLCYVAATRAMDHLVFCAHHVPSNSESLGELIFNAAKDMPQLWRRLPSVSDEGAGDEAAARAAPVEQVPSTPVVTTLAEYEAWTKRRLELIKDASRQANVRATEVALLAGITDGPEVSFEPEEADGSEEALAEPRRHGRAGTKLGRAVHASLQSLSLLDASVLAGLGGTDPEGASRRLVQIAHAQARAERIDDRGEEVARLTKAALNSPVVKRALASGTARRELYVAAPVGRTILDGYVDLCFTEDDGSLTVVDYKTDAVSSPTEAAQRAASYELQAASYAICLEQATSRSVGRCVLVFLAPPSQPIEHVIKDEALEEKKNEVREVIEGLG